jgi:creatinine amidohydrolase
VLLVNGHGSNQNLVEMAARLAVVEHPEALVAACFYLTSTQGAAAIDRVRSSDIGGMGHACELETSLYLHLNADAVDMSKAVDERGFPATEHAFMDWSDGPLKIMPWWSAFSSSGVQGDATKATAAKGKALYEAAVAEICGYVQELSATDIAVRKDHHDAEG